MEQTYSSLENYIDPQMVGFPQTVRLREQYTSLFGVHVDLFIGSNGLEPEDNLEEHGIKLGNYWEWLGFTWNTLEEEPAWTCIVILVCHVYIYIYLHVYSIYCICIYLPIYLWIKKNNNLTATSLESWLARHFSKIARFLRLVKYYDLSIYIYIYNQRNFSSR